MTDKPRSDHSDRSKQERIERLRQRLKDVRWSTSGERDLIGAMQGLLDLLSDEL